VWLKRNVSGCCDCGDPDAWNEKGFCTKHKGYSASSEVLLEQLPVYIKKAAGFVFDHICF
jgi:E3 ubiquitin-protein ligase UBR1